MLGRRIGIACGMGLVAFATSVSAQLSPTATLPNATLPNGVPQTVAPPQLQTPPSPVAQSSVPYDGATVPTTFNQPVTPAAGLPLAPPDSRPSTKLPLPKSTADGGSASRSSGGGTSTSTVLIALAVVLGLFFGLVALLRRGMPQQARTLPAEAVELLGRIALPGRRQGHLIRVGNKITLVSFANNETRPLVEITDPQEIDRLAGLCKQADPTSATRSFRSVVDGFFREKTPGKEAADE